MCGYVFGHYSQRCVLNNNGADNAAIKKHEADSKQW